MYRILDALHLVEEETLSLRDVIYHVDVTDQPIEQGQPHACCRHTHSYVSQEHRRANGLYQRALPRHLRSREEKEIMLPAHLQIIRNRIRTKEIEQSLRFHQ